MGWGTGNIGSGSGGLNFKIVGGTSEPSNVRENTIWVNTDQKITGWYFAATQPENMQEGEVWFPTGTKSAVEFNALRKNGIQVYPLSAKQMISGALVDVEAMSYQGGEWFTWWNGELYDSGNEFTNVTGGWYISRNYNATLTKNADSMVISAIDLTSSSSITMNNGLNIEYDNFTTVNVKISNFVTQHPNANIAVVFRTSANHDNGTEIAKKEYEGAISADTVLSLPIPSASVKTLLVYVYYGTATIKEIWME